VVIGDKVKVGRGFRCFHGVTLGDDGRKPGQPTLGDSVTVSAGAKVLGPLHIGDNVTIGANAVVLCDVRDGAVAVGVPARVLDRRRPAIKSVGHV
jgi:serine O-acetyltransferase